MKDFFPRKFGPNTWVRIIHTNAVYVFLSTGFSSDKQVHAAVQTVPRTLCLARVKLQTHDPTPPIPPHTQALALGVLTLPVSVSLNTHVNETLP